MQTIADVLTTELRDEPSSIPIFVEVNRKIFVGGPGGLVAEQGLELRLLIPEVRLGVMGAKAQFREFLAGEERVKQPTRKEQGTFQEVRASTCGGWAHNWPLAVL